MNVVNNVRSRGASDDMARVDPSLNRDMSSRFELEIAFLRIGAVIAFECALDINGMGVVPFNEIAVIAIPRADEIGKRRHPAGRQAASKSGRLAGQIDREID